MAERYAAELAGELAGKPLDRAVLAAFAEMVGDGLVADLGCGPGHVTAHLARLGLAVMGVDLSPGMIEVARRDHSALSFQVGSLTALPIADGGLAGAVALYSLIHLRPERRSVAYRELARVIAPGGVLLVAFHVASPEHQAGDVNHVTQWWGHQVDLDGYFIDPAEVVVGLTEVGFAVRAELWRQPLPDVEYPSRRCLLLARRVGDVARPADAARGR